MLKTECPLVLPLRRGLVKSVKTREVFQPKNTFIKSTPGEFCEDLLRASGLGRVFLCSHSKITM